MRKNVRGSVAREGIYTKPARCYVAYHVYVAELKETAQVPPYQHNLILPPLIIPLYLFYYRALLSLTNSIGTPKPIKGEYYPLYY